VTEEEVDRKPKKRQRLSWSELLKRVFQVYINVCPDCGGNMTFIATIIEPEVIRTILEHKRVSADLPQFAPANTAYSLRFYNGGP
jgi:hypothetical protein